VEELKKEKFDLLENLKLERFIWIEEGLKKFSELIDYDFPKAQYNNYSDFITDSYIISKELLNILNCIIDYRDIYSQIQNIKAEIDNISPKTTFEYYDDFFNKVDKYFKESLICSEPISNIKENIRDFNTYKTLLKDSQSILKLLKELAELDKQSKKLKFEVELNIS
ncbi:MAG: hypothetical protein HQK73_10335, partial [Desulfamplus sp.]|nr:hypothetical protein [Desulfamplus sp.]